MTENVIKFIPRADNTLEAIGGAIQNLKNIPMSELIRTSLANEETGDSHSALMILAHFSEELSIICLAVAKAMLEKERGIL